jgi:hypothetical protein
MENTKSQPISPQSKAPEHAMKLLAEAHEVIAGIVWESPGRKPTRWMLEVEQLFYEAGAVLSSPSPATEKEK